MTITQPVGYKKEKISVLKKREDFLRVAKAQTRWVSPGMVVQVCPQPHQDGAGDQQIRVGFTASKKVGSAVQRNRAKRRLREVARRVIPDKGHKGHDYVLIARAGIENRAFDDLIRDLKWSLKRLAGQKSGGAPDSKSPRPVPGKQSGKINRAAKTEVKK
ncbi:ribonuclease P protein component [Luteithermobacter gelatinilyticus]|uniref:ribonuclease P protein component n=1 Tax=Luteithermobacter gelatinilyticus TaxID=2582913 RepID=UPI001AEF46D5|nr:ribonuclease P protein component [Luteithermobacter gelatinilyticus]|tara:strand:+ start:19800 stop:20279 length:480 start_codon:yes stop_codon:yes gene_type:complete